MLSPVSFTCILNETYYKYVNNIDSDIVKLIYTYYEECYQNYTLVELIYELYMNRIEIICDWNKNSIIMMMKELNIKIPEKHIIQKSEWEINSDNDTNSIYIYKSNFEINEGDIFQLSDNNKYIIIEIKKENSYIILLNINHDYISDLYLTIDINKFIEILDFKDITILANIDKYYFSRYIGNM